MRKENVVNYLEGQIDAYKRLRKVFEGTKDLDILKKFDGKVINKNIQEGLREYYRDNKDVQYLIFKRYDYKDNTYTLEGRIARTVGSSYRYDVVDYKTINITIVDEKRFSLAEFISAVDKALDDFDKDIATLEKELKEVDKIIKEYEGILKSQEDFKTKYSFYIRQDMRF